MKPQNRKGEVKITHKTFPTGVEPFSEKKTMEYGLRVGQAIQYEWFKRDGSRSCKYFDQRVEFHRRRLYANGMQSISKYKKNFAVNGDLSYLNLDWNIVPVIPKFRDLLINGMAQRDYSIKAQAVDPVSSENKMKYRENIEKDMATKDMLMTAKNRMGIDAFSMPPEQLPESDEEKELHMNLKYKPSIEISEELAIQSIFNENRFDDTTKFKMGMDAVDVGMVTAKHRFDHKDGIKLEYVDPADLIWSYTEDPFFQDVFYWGEFKNTNTSEVFKEFPELDKSQREEIQSIAGSWNDYYSLDSNYNNDNLDGKVGLLYFDYQTTRDRIYKKKKTKKGGSKVIERDDNFTVNGNDNPDFEKLTKTDIVWFEGVIVLGTNIILKWELCKNMVKEDSNLTGSQLATKSNYVACAPKLYKGYIDSLVSKMIPIADDVQISWMKLQQIKQRLVPDGQYLDVDGLSGINLGNGQSYTVTDALNMYFQTGTVIGRSSTVGGEFNHAKVPIQEIRHSSGQDKISSIWFSIQKSLDMIANITGINQAVDASNPDKDSLVGIQKMAAYNSNVATRHTLKAVMYVTKELARCASARLSDVLEYSELKDDFIRKIGQTAVTNLEEIAKLHLFDFAIDIELHPDEEERAKLEADITLEIQQGNLGVEDKYEILAIKNIKLASSYLAIKKKKVMKEKQEQKMAEIEAQKQANIESSNAAAQAQTQVKQMEGQIKNQIEQTKSNGKIMEIREQARVDRELMAAKFNYEMKLKGVEVQGQKEKEKEKEDRKDERTKIQAGQQSKLIEQRTQKGSAIEFESNNDSLDRFSLGSFKTI